ncbi:MAG: hypothetical protein IJL52_08115 [Clostridia bacterium]|nr:hypothetical protein [Clostridia bacterium]
MACFLVPGTEAIVVTAAALILKKHEQVKYESTIKLNNKSAAAMETKAPAGFSRKLFWLAGLLWGGVILLAFEHLWHGEIQPFFPFLTAATEGPEAVSEMLGEMMTVGVTMAVLVTVVWAAMVAVSVLIEKRAVSPAEANA